MYDPFELPVLYNGEELVVPAQLLQRGYTPCFQIEVNGQQVLFERDDEGSYRALMDPETVQNTKVDRNFLQAIAEALELILK